MSTPLELTPFLEPLAAVHRLLARFGDEGMIIGGLAASLLGSPRLTADVDAVILLSVTELPELVRAAEQEGFTTRIEDAEEFARRNRVLLLRHRGSGINVDMSLGILPFEVEAVKRSVVRKIGELTLRLPTAEDLIIFKAVAHRPQDLLDIRALIEINPNLDRTRIKHWVVEFARALDMPELWNDIADSLPGA
ncbi:MAG: nucleotidyltransferase [Chloroflexota bacterium]